MSYEAKARGVTRGMRLSEIKHLCPDAILLPSDYETYSLLSERVFAIVRRYTPDVEEASIDECFADLTGLRRPFRCSYPQLAARIKRDLDTELGFTFSVGLGPNKLIAKIASKWEKPSGLTVIPGHSIHVYLRDLPVGKVWGIGPQTEALLAKHGVTTALQFAQQSETWVARTLTKPFYEIWQELHGMVVFPLDTQEKTTYSSIQKVKTFTPPSNDRAFVFAQLSKNIENACIKARRYKLAARGAVMLLKTQQFRLQSVAVTLSRATAFPHEILSVIAPVYDQVFQPSETYRATGIVLTKLEEDHIVQLDLFGEALKAERISQVYEAMDRIGKKYGKHTVFLGSSWLAHRFAQNMGARGDAPQRTRALLKEETKRKRLGIPMLMGKVD